MPNENTLRGLAKFLREVAKAEQFDMRNFGGPRGNSFVTFQPSDIRKRHGHGCGTVACALGHAPLLFPPEKDESWATYSLRVFGLKEHHDEWLWVFGPAWAHTDNTKEGAVARIEWLIDKGLPANWRDQMDGEDAICYS